MKNNLLEVGDVIELNKGTIVNGYIHEKFMDEDRIFMDTRSWNQVVIGKYYRLNLGSKVRLLNKLSLKISKIYDSINITPDQKLISRQILEVIPNIKDDTYRFDSGEYLVISTKMDGGSEREGYPNGWSVTCLKLNKDGSYNPDGAKISFYQSECFNNMLPNLVPTRKMTKILRYE